MIDVGLAVGIWKQHGWVEHPVSRVEKLCSFEDHLYDMLVAMIFRGCFWVEGKEEDIHCRRHGPLAGLAAIRFYAL